MTIQPVAPVDLLKSNQARPLLAPEWLADHLDSPDLLILDVRSAVDGAGREAYERGHVPGAIHSDYAKDGWRATKGMATGMLPDESDLVALLGRIGLMPDLHAVIVSTGTTPGDFCGAARVYWTLRLVGHRKVSILDGGMNAWGRNPAWPLEVGPGGPRPPSAPYPIAYVEALRSDLAAVQAAMVADAAVLLDSRAMSYFEGREKSPQAARAGRLPGAIHLHHATAFDSSEMALKMKSELMRIFATVPAKPIINYCNTGQQAATNWFVLSEILGRTDVSLYDGSLSEWTQDPDRPVDTGAPPPHASAS
jgi:thiosulfate/3-mercaptopyruvate sulfurtransferase